MKTSTYLSSLAILAINISLAILTNTTELAILAVGMVIVFVADDICERLGKKS